MVSPRFTNILLILICHLPRFSTGHSLQVSVKKSTIISTGIELQTDRSSVNVEEMHQGLPETDQRTRFRQAGRRMESRRLSKVMESQHWIAEASTATDGEVHCIEHCDNGGKGILYVKRKFCKRSRHSVRVKMSGFVSWNADYHVPRPHPPKNN